MSGPIVLMLLVFAGGWFAHVHYVSTITADTTHTVTPATPPPVIPPTVIPATPTHDPGLDTSDTNVPSVDTLYLYVPDPELLAYVDTLIADRDSLRSRLTVALAYHKARHPFEFKFEQGGHLQGYSDLGYSPVRETFSISHTPTELYLPMTTITKKEAWWVKPAVFVGGALTAHFLHEKDNAAALITGGVTTTIIILEL